MGFDFSETASVLSTCLSSETPEGAERAEYVLSSQFIATLATGLSCTIAALNPCEEREHVGWSEQQAHGRVCVGRGMRCGAGKQHFPSGIVKSGRPCQEM